MTSEEAQNPTEADKIPEEKDSLDFKALYYSQPSQKDKIKKDFTEYSKVDITLLNKKRERENDEEEKKNNIDKELNQNKQIDNNINEESKNNENNLDDKDNTNEDINKTKNINNNNESTGNHENINNNTEVEEIKENDLENNLPKELLELIEERKDKEPFTFEDFEKYRAYKKLNVNFHK